MSTRGPTGWRRVLRSIAKERRWRVIWPRRNTGQFVTIQLETCWRRFLCAATGFGREDAAREMVHAIARGFGRRRART